MDIVMLERKKSEV